MCDWCSYQVLVPNADKSGFVPGGQQVLHILKTRLRFLRSKYRKGIKVSKLVFYAQSTGTVISGRYKSFFFFLKY